MVKKNKITIGSKILFFTPDKEYYTIVYAIRKVENMGIKTYNYIVLDEAENFKTGKRKL